MHPRSGFRSGGTCERTLFPVFVPGEHPNVPSFQFSFQGNVRQNHPYGKPPFSQPPKGLPARNHFSLKLCHCFGCGSDAVRMWFGCGSDVVRTCFRRWLGRVFGSGADGLAEVTLRIF